MNAPAAAGSISDAVFEHLPLSAIAPSQTPSQIRRRKRYTPETIAEFAKNIAAAGVMEPVIVRPLATPRDLATYELLCGERRWLAAKEAGLAHIPALIRDVSARDVVLFQFSENLHRENTAPLEEAESIRDLMKDRGIKADQAAELIGKSPRLVYNRLKLLALKHPGAIEALEAGKLEHTKALQIARYPSEKTQKKAYELVGDESISLRQATELLRDKLMARLDEVPFDLEDATMENTGRVQFDCQATHRNRDSTVYAPPMPACTACPNYSANDPELDEQITGWYGLGARACTDKPCHDFKVTFFFNRRIDEARRDGRAIIEGPEAKLIRGPQWQHTLNGYIDLDAECSQPIPLKLTKKHPEWAQLQGNPTYRQVLGDREELKIAAAVLIDPFNKQPRDILPVKDAKLMLNGLDIDFAIPATPREQPASGSNTDSAGDHQRRDEERDAARLEAEKQAAREEQERAFRRKLLALVHEKWKGPLKRDELQAVCDRLMHEGEWPEFVDQLYGGDINTSRMKEPELARLIFSLSIGLSVDFLGDSPELLIAAAKRFKIDPAKVRKQVKAELGGVEEPAPKKPAAKKKAKKK